MFQVLHKRDFAEEHALCTAPQLFPQERASVFCSRPRTGTMGMDNVTCTHLMLIGWYT